VVGCWDHTKEVMGGYRMCAKGDKGVLTHKNDFSRRSTRGRHNSPWRAHHLGEWEGVEMN
jgi:hypothetical protein